MSRCEICDQELTRGEFEEKLGICVNCIMIESRVDSYKAFFTIIALILGSVLFVTALLAVLVVLVSSFVNFENYLLQSIPPLTICIIIGPGLIYLIFHKSV